MNSRCFARSMAVNRCLTHRATVLLAALLFAFSTALPFPIPAHEGEDHGAPQPVTITAPGEKILVASGGGSVFEAVLKYRPFVRGEAVAVTLYLVSAETNRPLADASVNATLSEGDRSTAVAFAPKPGGPFGAYSATVTAETTVPMSWLFDVTAGAESDLIGVTGFQARPPEPASPVSESAPHRDGKALPRLAMWFAIGALSLTIAFVAGRATARKRVSA